MSIAESDWKKFKKVRERTLDRFCRRVLEQPGRVSRCGTRVSRAPTGILHAAFVAALVFGSLPATVSAESACTGIHVRVQNIRNSTGAVACALFEAPQGYPSEFLRYASRIMMMKIRDSRARCDFLDIPPGTYALAVIHDEDMNGKLATNWLGIPREGYGFSSGADVSGGAPSFDDASFSYGGENLDLTIRLDY